MGNYNIKQPSQTYVKRGKYSGPRDWAVGPPAILERGSDFTTFYFTWTGRAPGRGVLLHNRDKLGNMVGADAGIFAPARAISQFLRAVDRLASTQLITSYCHSDTERAKSPAPDM